MLHVHVRSDRPMRLILVVAWLAVGVEWTGRAFGDVPRDISLQGLLEDSNTGQPVNGTVDFCVSIWDAESGGCQVWPPPPQGQCTGACHLVDHVEVRDGLFKLVFGDPDLTPQVFGKVGDGPMPRYLELRTRKTASDPFEAMSPRIVLRTVPYAYRAAFVDSPELVDDLSLGSCKPPAQGTLHVFNGANPCVETMELFGYGNAGGGELRLRGPRGAATILAFAQPDGPGIDGGELQLRNASNDKMGIMLRGKGPEGGSIHIMRDNGDIAALLQAGANSVFELRHNNDEDAILLQSNATPGGGGKLSVFNGQSPNQETITLDGNNGRGGSVLSMRNGQSLNQETFTLFGNGAGRVGDGAAEAWLSGPQGLGIVLDAHIQNGNGSFMRFYNDLGVGTVEVRAGGSSGDGHLSLLQEDGSSGIECDASGGADGGSKLRMYNGPSPNQETITLDANGPYGAGFVGLNGINGTTRVQAWAGDGGLGIPYSSLRLFNGSGNLKVNLEAGSPGGGEFGSASMLNSGGLTTVVLDAGGPDVGDGAKLQMMRGPSQVEGVTTATIYSNNGSADGASLHLYSADGVQKVDIRADDGSHGACSGYFNIKGTISASGTIQGNAGCDLAESFDHSDAVEALPGMVMVIDPDHVGELAVSTQAYDRKVAGIVSGAGGLQPGVVLGGEPRNSVRADVPAPVNSPPAETPRDLKIAARPDVHIALSGRVYCFVDATDSAVEVGDLLTTSNISGYAMKVTDFARSQGAVLGKAMQPLEKGKKGLILVLVTLQ